MLRLLRRAFDLWPDVSNAEPSRFDLLQRIRHAADQAGAQEEELAAVDDLLALVDRERDDTGVASRSTPALSRVEPTGLEPVTPCLQRAGIRRAKRRMASY